MKHLFTTFLLFITSAAIAQAPLPQSVYDQFADPKIKTITLPQGRYALRKNLPTISRSGVTVNCNGCTLLIDPAKDFAPTNEMYPVRVYSAPVNKTFGKSPSGNVSRTMSRLTGKIDTDATRLTMVEKVDLQPGEIVLIAAGANKSDPVEPYMYIVATVTTVDMTSGIVTFSKALGVSVPSYGSIEGMKAVSAPDMHSKIQPWGAWFGDSNFSKGFGLDHGLQRFVGGMVSGVTINDLSLELVPATTTATMPNGAWLVSTWSTTGFTLNGLNIVNPQGMCVHQMRSFNSSVNRVKLTGKGRCKVWNDRTMESIAFTAWGGDSMAFNDVDISATDTTVFGFEVNPSRTTLTKLIFKSQFTSARDYPSSPGILGLYNVLDTPRIKDATIEPTWTGGSKPEWFSYSPLLFDGKVKIGGASLLTFLDWGNQRKVSFDGTLMVGNVEYGPLERKYVTYTIPYGSFHKQLFSPGISLPGCRFRIITKGDLRDVTDSFGNRYGYQTTDWQQLAPNHWYQIAAGDTALADYLGRHMMFWFESTTTQKAAAIEFDYTHLPKR